jgi:ferredoxin-NADP reductase
MVLRLLQRSLRRGTANAPVPAVTSFDPTASVKARLAQEAAARSGLVDLEVRDVSTVADGVIAITLRDLVEGELPPWSPGAHLELHLPSGLRRQYSLCGDPTDRTTYRVCVLREPDGRGGSEELHGLDLVGMRLTSSIPRNHFELVGSRHYRFVAGGIGITPIRAMVAAVPEGSSYELLYGGRTRSSMAFLDELARICGDRLTVVPQDEAGLLDLETFLGGADAGTAIYCCGPAPLIDAVQEVHGRIAPEAGLHFERFTASEEAVRARAEAAASDTEFTVELRRSGVTKVVAADQTLLDAVLAEDPEFGFSCEEGHCGSCRVAVLKGEVDHRDQLLSPEERAANDQMYICVSRAQGDDGLVIDA